MNKIQAITGIFGVAALTALQGCATPTGGRLGQSPDVGTAVQNGTAQIGDALRRAFNPDQYVGTAVRATRKAAGDAANVTTEGFRIRKSADVQRWESGVLDEIAGTGLRR